MAIWPGCSPTAMPCVLPRSGLPYSVFTPLIWHRQGPCPILYHCAFSVPLVSPVLPSQAFVWPGDKPTQVCWGIRGCSWEEHPGV